MENVDAFTFLTSFKTDMNFVWIFVIASETAIMGRGKNTSYPVEGRSENQISSARKPNSYIGARLASYFKI